MLVSFELSMPGVNSWNGRWSGQDKVHAIVLTLRKHIPKLGYYSYDFGDGWRAGITVREVDVPTAKMLRKKSVGFCGYDWMVDSIVSDGDIYGPTKPKPMKGKYRFELRHDRAGVFELELINPKGESIYLVFRGNANNCREFFNQIIDALNVAELCKEWFERYLYVPSWNDNHVRDREGLELGKKIRSIFNKLPNADKWKG